MFCENYVYIKADQKPQLNVIFGSSESLYYDHNPL